MCHRFKSCLHDQVYDIPLFKTRALAVHLGGFCVARKTVFTDSGANPGGYQRQYRNVLSFLLLIFT
nr:MAG TPA: hypothetical protein [Caudoviricetes sp.]